MRPKAKVGILYTKAEPNILQRIKKYMYDDIFKSIDDFYREITEFDHDLVIDYITDKIMSEIKRERVRKSISDKLTNLHAGKGDRVILQYDLVVDVDTVIDERFNPKE